MSADDVALDEWRGLFLAFCGTKSSLKEAYLPPQCPEVILGTIHGANPSLKFNKIHFYNFHVERNRKRDRQCPLPTMHNAAYLKMQTLHLKTKTLQGLKLKNLINVIPIKYMLFFIKHDLLFVWSMSFLIEKVILCPLLQNNFMESVESISILGR